MMNEIILFKKIIKKWKRPSQKVQECIGTVECSTLEQWSITMIAEKNLKDAAFNILWFNRKLPLLPCFFQEVLNTALWVPKLWSIQAQDCLL